MKEAATDASIIGVVGAKVDTDLRTSAVGEAVRVLRPNANNGDGDDGLDEEEEEENLGVRVEGEVLPRVVRDCGCWGVGVATAIKLAAT